MRCACVDIGSNTTRLLVADVTPEGLVPVLAHKAHTGLGAALRRTGALPLSAVAAEVAAQVAAARAAGADRLRVVATAAVRAAGDAGPLRAEVRALAGAELEVIDARAEARLAFLGATRRLAPPADPARRVAVVDVGGGSTELAVGTVGGGVEWAGSAPVGSGVLAWELLDADPPGPDALEAVRRRAFAALRGLAPPPVELGLAVGGSAASLATVAGPRLDAAAVAIALGRLCAAPAAEVARRHGLEPERVRLLPAGLVILAAAADAVGRPLEIGCGGLREGVCLELSREPPAGPPPRAQDSRRA